jgi:hypothetical protein
MTKTEYIAHLRSLGLCKDMAECMAEQALYRAEERPASIAVASFKDWPDTEESFVFWESFFGALRWAGQQDARDLKGLK